MRGNRDLIFADVRELLLIIFRRVLVVVLKEILLEMQAETFVNKVISGVCFAIIPAG